MILPGAAKTSMMSPATPGPSAKPMMNIDAPVAGAALIPLPVALAVIGSPALTENAGTETWPAESDVRLGVTYGPTGSEYTGAMAEGGGSYPTANQIAAAVWAYTLP